MAISLEPNAQFLWGFHRDIALILWHTMKMKTEFLFFLYASTSELYLGENPIKIEDTVPEIEPFS